MSLILEALKKAERQHKLGEVPGISSHVGEQPGSRSNRKGWVMLGLFALVMLLAGAYLGGGFQRTPRERNPQPIVNAERPAVVHGGELTARPEHARIDQPETPTQDRAGSSVAPTAEAPLAESAVPEPQAATVAVTPEPQDKPPPKAAPEPPPKAKPLNEMPAGFVSNLPPMNIDIHSYDQRPEKRYVLINMQRYHEGDYLAEGPRIISIRPDGVELEHMGARFILPIGTP